MRESAYDFDGAALLVYLSALQPTRIEAFDSRQPRFWFRLSAQQCRELAAAYADEEQPILFLPFVRIQGVLRAYVRLAQKSGVYTPTLTPKEN